jgi:hypothetical protein
MATSVTLADRRHYRTFSIGLALTSIVIVFAGFARTYYLNSYFAQRTLRWFLHVHGAIFSAWFVLLLVQIVLVTIGRTDLHRRLGVLGAALVCIMVPLGFAIGIHAAKYGSPSTPPGASRLGGLVVPFFDMVVFGMLAGAGLLYRRKPQIHKRLMILATLSILTAAIARIPLNFIQTHGVPAIFGITAALVLVFICYDTVFNRRLHPANLWGGSIILLSIPLRFAISGTAAWLAFASWLTSWA